MPCRIAAQYAGHSPEETPAGLSYKLAVLDSGAPVGDSMISISGLETPVAPGSTVGGVIIINSIKAEVARLLTDAGQPPKVLTASAIVGNKKAKELFESAYDEHAHRLAKLYKNAGK